MAAIGGSAGSDRGVNMSDFENNSDDGLADWEPAEGVVTHGASEIPESMHFFVNPPPEIGEVQTGYSTLEHGKRPMAMGTRFFIGALISAVGIGVGVGIGHSPIDLICFILGPIIGIGVWAWLGFKHTCSYVGKAGMARFVLKGSLDAEPTEEVFVFADATDLKASQTRHYQNGIYTGTHYSFVWTTPDGRDLLKLGGTYSSKEGFPKVKDPYHFARVGEIVWSDHISERMQMELDEHGSVEFPVNKNDFVRVGRGFLEFDFKGAVQRVPAEEIKKLNIGGGVFTIHTNDAGWFGSKGKFSFNYGNLGNASMFITAIERLLGYEFD